MKRFLFPIIGLLAASGCGRLETIPYSPSMTPDTWCALHHCVTVNIGPLNFVLTTPSSSAIVFLLGLVTLGAALYFFRIREGNRSRLWWGIGLLIWSAATFCAGVSYQAFGYEIKCAGREVCRWTSWWEVTYLILMIPTLSSLLIAEAFSCFAPAKRRVLFIIAAAIPVVHTGIMLTGALLPDKFLMSFEMMVMFASPFIVFFLLLNTWRYIRFRSTMDLALAGATALLILTLAAYFYSLVTGLTQNMWDGGRGIWFSDNDVLHIGFIIWMVYAARVVAGRVRDMN